MDTQNIKELKDAYFFATKIGSDLSEWFFDFEESNLAKVINPEYFAFQKLYHDLQQLEFLASKITEAIQNLPELAEVDWELEVEERAHEDEESEDEEDE